MYNFREPLFKQSADLTSWRKPSAIESNVTNMDVTSSNCVPSFNPPLTKPSNVHPARRAFIKRHVSSGVSGRSTSLDEEAHLHSLEQHNESDTTSGHDGAGRASVSMDKISTMTLAEFKSLISSTLSVPEEPKQGSSEAYSGQTGNSDSGSSGSSNTKMTGAYNNGDICRSKMSKIISNTKTPKGSADPDKIAPKDEYQMARPKPPSQIKRDAVAKVAGAISNWVESKTGADTVDAVSGRSKTPARPKTLLGPNNGTSQNVLHECTDEDNLEISGAVVNSLMHPLLCTSQERPVTPSRIPKPSFLPRPKTPVSFLTESPNDVTNHHGFPTHHGTSFNIAKSSINSRPVALSRSNSNSSSVKSIDEAPVSPASSLSDDRVFKLHSKTRRLSNASDSFSTNANTNTTNMGRSYKDIYTAKRAASSGSEGRIPSTRAVTPGPREKWTLCGSGCSSSFLENAVSTPSIPRRRSINISCQADKQKSFCSTSPANHTSSSTERDQEMTITNEITFSDDEEINELVKNAAMKAKTQNFRSSSVNTRKLVHQTMKGNDELLMIHRDLSMKGNSDVNYSVVRRPASRGSSVDRASPATVASKLSHISNFAVHAHKPVSDGKGSGPDESSIQANKGHNRTDAWVDSTLSDNKKKPSPRPKQTKSFGRDISASELASRPLEEIQAILTEPRNGFVHVDIRTLEPPPEDPEMFRKMEKLFEKYREMELKALAKELSQGGRPAPVKRHSDSQSAKSDRHGSSRRPSKPSTSVKTSSVSFEPSPDHISGHATPATGKVSLHGGDKCARSSSTPKPFHSQQYRSSNNSPAFTSSSYETEQCLGSDISNHNESLSKILKTSGSENDHKGLGVLQDIDPELAKNPAALISKIKEILKVRPRKDENTKGPTRIPAPSALNKQNRSKSVTNLFSDDVSTGSSHDNNISQPDGQVINTNSDKFHDVHSFQSRQHNTFDKFASNEPDGADDVADEVPALTHTWSVQSDSSDSQSKTETPVPKLAMPLTTGRSTLISRKGDRLGRSMSQDKENLANTESMITSQPVLSQTEDEAEFV